MADDPQVTITPEEIQRTVAELKSRGVIHAGTDRAEAREAIKRFLIKAKQGRSTPQAIEGGATSVMSSAMRGVGELVAGPLSLMQASSKLTGPALRAVGLDTLGGAAESVGDTAGALADISRRDVAQAYQPDPHDVIAKPGVANYLKMQAPGLAAQTAAIVGTGGVAGVPAAVGLASTGMGGSAWAQAKAQGATDEQALGAAAIGLGAGAAQAALLGRIALRSPTLMAKLSNTGALAGTNLGVEAIQDEFAKHTYDPERRVLEGWRENLAATAVMALVGGVMSPRPKPKAPEPVKVEAPYEGDPTLRAGAGSPAAEALAHPDMSGTSPVAEPRQPVTAKSVPLESLEKPPSGPHPLLSFTEKAIAKDLERARAAETTKALGVFGNPVRAEGYLDRLRKASNPANPERARAAIELARLRETLTPEQRTELDRPTGRFSLQELESAAAAKGLRKEANVQRYNARKGIGTPRAESEMRWLEDQAKWAELNVGKDTGIVRDAVAMGSRLSQQASAAIAGATQGRSMRDVAVDPVASQAVLRAMQESGVLTAEDAAMLSAPDGSLHPAGADLVRHALLGSVVPNARVISEAPPPVREALLAELPALLSIKAHWPEFQGVTQRAMEGLAELKGRSIDEALLNGLGGLPSPWMTDKQAVSMMRAMQSDGAESLGRRLSNISDGAEAIAKPQDAVGILSRLAEQAKARIRSRRGRAMSGIDPFDIADHAVVGADLIARGIRAFAQWASEMVRQFGEEIRPHLAAIYQKSLDTSAQAASGHFSPGEQTVPGIYRIHMPESAIPITPELLETLTPIEQKRPELFGPEPERLGASMLPEDMMAAAKALKVPVEDVALAAPNPDTVAPTQDMPVLGTGEPTEAIRSWYNRRETGKTHARVQETITRDKLRAIVGDRGFKQWFKESVGHAPREEAMAQADYAMDHFVELGDANREAVLNAAAQLTDKEFAPFRDDIIRSQSMPEPMRKLAEEIRAQNAAEGERYKDQELIQASRANYTAHLWDWKDGVLNFESKGLPKTQTGAGRFGMNNARQMARSYPSVLEGLLDMQRRKMNGDDYAVPKLRGAITKQQVVREQMSSLILDRNLMETGIKSGLFAPYKAGEDWQLIPHKGFRKWFPIGRVSGEDILVTTNDQQVRLNMGSETTIPKNKVKLWGDSLYTDAGGNVWMRREMYAPPEIATKLNNALGDPNARDVKIGPVNLTEMYHAAEAVRNVMLSSDFSMHINLGQRNLWLAKSWQEANPLAANRLGESAIRSFGPNLRLLQEQGLKLNVQSDWDELGQRRTTRVGQVLDRTVGAKEARSLYKSFIHWQEDGRMGFKAFGRRLKAQWALLELARLKAKNAKLPTSKQLPDTELAGMVARASNDFYTGQNLVERGRDPRFTKAARIALIAPDWLEGNLRLAVKSLPGNKAVHPLERQMYQRAMVGSLVKAYIASTLFKAMMASLSHDDPKEKKKNVWDQLSQDYRGNPSSLFDLDVTPIYDATGGHDGGDKYLSMMGKMDDAYRLMPFMNPEFGWAWKGKLGILPHIALDFFLGSPHRGGRFTTTEELIGIDDRGTYDKVHIGADGQVQIPGMEKGHDRKWELTTPGFPGGAVGTDEMLSFLGYQMRGTMPIPAQNVLSALSGEMRWMDAVLGGVGFSTHSAPKEKK